MTEVLIHACEEWQQCSDTIPRINFSCCSYAQRILRPAACKARLSRQRCAAMASAKLPRRKLGNTGLEVSVIGFGASPLGGVFEVCPVMCRALACGETHMSPARCGTDAGTNSPPCRRG